VHYLIIQQSLATLVSMPFVLADERHVFLSCDATAIGFGKIKYLPPTTGFPFQSHSINAGSFATDLKISESILAAKYLQLLKDGSPVS
jgi:hypothetical protein